MKKMSHMYRLCGIYLLVVCATAATPSSAAKRADPADLQTVVFEAEAGRQLQVFLRGKAHLARQCKFFGYITPCIKVHLTPKDSSGMLRRARGRSTQIIRQLLGRSPRPSSHRDLYYSNFTKQAGDSNDPYVFFADKVPAYIPFSAYNGTPASLSDNEYDQISSLAGFYDVSSQSLPTLSDASLVGHEFEDLTRRHDAWPDSGSILATFEHAFFYKEDVIRGDLAEGFWQRFAAYSKSADLTKCSGGCYVAIYKPFKNSVQTIAYCSIRSAAGILGAPEDCQNVVVHTKAGTYILAPMALYYFVGRNGEGGNEITCTMKRSTNGDPTANLVADQVSSALRKLIDTRSQKPYAQDRTNSPQSVVITAVNRFGQSAFIPPLFEISTIRVSISESDDEITAKVALTVTVSRTKSDVQEGYNLVSIPQAGIVRGRIIELMPKPFECKVNRGA